VHSCCTEVGWPMTSERGADAELAAEVPRLRLGLWRLVTCRWRATSISSHCPHNGFSEPHMPFPECNKSAGEL
jgi:hypothetical protein